jgi:PAS domain S-box-containing protein
MRTTPHAGLAIAVAAICELIEHARASHHADAQTAQALDFALDGLGLMWEALEGKEQSDRDYERDCVDFFESAPLACVLTDLNGMVRRANRAAVELLGVSAAELLRKPLGSVFPAGHDVLTPGYLLDRTQESGTRMLHWRTTVQGAAGAVEIEASVSKIGRPRGGVSGLCWLLLPAARAQPEAQESRVDLDAQIAVPQPAVGIEFGRAALPGDAPALDDGVPVGEPH